MGGSEGHHVPAARRGSAQFPKVSACQRHALRPVAVAAAAATAVAAGKRALAERRDGVGGGRGGGVQTILFDLIWVYVVMRGRTD